MRYISLFFGLLLLASCTTISNDSPSSSLFQFQETSYDFGTIKQSGGKVVREFPFTYTGKNPVTVVSTPTSCACTSATISKNIFKTGEPGILTVIFNPNLHEEPEGKFFKTVRIMTEPSINPTPEVTIWAEIDLDLGPEAYELQNDEHDE